MQTRSTRTSTQSALIRLARSAHSWLPNPLVEPAMALTLNRAFDQPLRRGELDFLQGRWVKTRITDLDFEFSVTLANRRLKVASQHRSADVVFEAELLDLMAIVAGRVDPDTLFFRRKLSLGGDTELGLALKNFLDSQDPAQLIPAPGYRLLLKAVD